MNHNKIGFNINLSPIVNILGNEEFIYRIVGNRELAANISRNIHKYAIALFIILFLFAILSVAIFVLNVELNRTIICEKSQNICNVHSFKIKDIALMLIKKDVSEMDKKIQNPKVKFNISDVQNYKCEKHVSRSSFGKSHTHHYKTKYKSVDYGTHNELVPENQITKITYNAFLVLNKEKKMYLGTYNSSNECSNICSTTYKNIKELPEVGEKQVFPQE